MRISPHDHPSHPFPSPEDFLGRLTEALPSFGAIDWVSSTGSTNADLSLRAQLIRAQQPTPPRPWLLGAHLQTAGKGRAGRPWANEAGSTLMFSCAFATDIPLAQLPGIAPALGVSTCLALRSLFAPQGNQTDISPLTPLNLKWPNDLQWHGAKLAGLLIETAPASTVVVGMGLNLRGAAALSAQLGREIADLGQIEQACNRSLHPAQLVAHIAQTWQQALQDYATNGYTAFTHSFDIVDALAGQSVQVMDQGKILHQGIAQGTDPLGRLRVMTETGLVPVLVGDVSIRPAHPFKGTP